MYLTCIDKNTSTLLYTLHYTTLHASLPQALPIKYWACNQDTPLSVDHSALYIQRDVYVIDLSTHTVVLQMQYTLAAEACLPGKNPLSNKNFSPYSNKLFI